MEIDETGDDGRVRTGTVWTVTTHAFTAVVGAGVLALPWSTAQLGWILGPIVLVLFGIITYYMAILLCDCYRSPDPVTGRRNRTYIDAVTNILGPRSKLICGILQYSILWGAMIGYTVTVAISIASLKRSICFHDKGQRAHCEVSGNLYMAVFGAAEILLSQFPNLDKVAFLSVIATITSLAYSTIALGMSGAKLSSNHEFRGSITVAEKLLEGEAAAARVWRGFQAFGNIALAYTFSGILLEIQDTLKPNPPENKVMKKASLYSITATAMFYISLGCIGYAAFGNGITGNVLAGFYKPFWLVDIANISVVIHLVGAYQLFAQPIFAIHENHLAKRWPTSPLNATHTITLPFTKKYSFIFTLNRLLLRTLFVILTTTAAMMLPFFNAILGLLGAMSFWPLTVYFPVRMYMMQTKIKAGSYNWIFFQSLSMLCLIVSLISGVGSVAGIHQSLKTAKLFHIDL